MKIKLFAALFFCILLGAFFYFKFKKEEEKGKIVYLANGYSITSNLGIEIPASLYFEGDSKTHTNGTLSRTYVLVFNSTLDFEGCHLGPDVLSIYPYEKFLTMSELSNKSFTKINVDSAYQSDKYLYDVGVVNNTVLYANPPIKYANFYDGKLVFNTYGPLNKFGDSIILKFN